MLLNPFRGGAVLVVSLLLVSCPWAWAEPLSVKLSRAMTVAQSREQPIRHVITRLCTERGIAVVVDRRIDLDREVAVVAAAVPLQAILTESLSPAVVVPAGETLYVAPPETAAVIRTLIALRADELARLKLPAKRRTELTAASDWQTDELATPAEIVDLIAARGQIKVTGTDQIPHDLWTAQRFGKASVVESLQLVLVQFDLTFTWAPQADSVEIVPIARPVAVTRSHKLPKSKKADVRKKVEDRFPAATWSGDSVTLAGTVEDQDELRLLLAGRSPTPVKPRAADKMDLSRRSFTWRTKDQSVGGLLRTLQSNDVPIEYEAAELAAAGIDLNTVINLDLKEARIEELLEALCEPVGLAFEIRDGKVHLRPARPR